MQRRFRLAAALGAAAWFFPHPYMNAAAQDVAAGRSKAIACQTCHGVDGIATLPGAPNLAAQPATYLVRALRAYRSGERRDEVMAIAAKPLSDDDIRDLAAYYAAIQIEVKARPQ